MRIVVPFVFTVQALDPALFRDPYDMMDSIMEKSCGRKVEYACSLMFAAHGYLYMSLLRCR
jgi:hypothetical protein